MHSNHTETNAKVLPKRAAYVAAHREYFEYLQLLLDRAALPHCNVHLPNLTTMAAMVAELRVLNPTAPWLNEVVLGRLLHRVLPRLLKWHGGKQSVFASVYSTHFFIETTVYRLPEILLARRSFAMFVLQEIAWSNEHDQWQLKSCF